MPTAPALDAPAQPAAAASELPFNIRPPAAQRVRPSPDMVPRDPVRKHLHGTPRGRIPIAAVVLMGNAVPPRLTNVLRGA